MFFGPGDPPVKIFFLKKFSTPLWSATFHLKKNFSNRYTGSGALIRTPDTGHHRTTQNIKICPTQNKNASLASLAPLNKKICVSHELNQPLCKMNNPLVYKFLFMISYNNHWYILSLFDVGQILMFCVVRWCPVVSVRISARDPLDRFEKFFF